MHLIKEFFPPIVYPLLLNIYVTLSKITKIGIADTQ
jgi:hypothetical protein